MDCVLADGVETMWSAADLGDALIDREPPAYGDNGGISGDDELGPYSEVRWEGDLWVRMLPEPGRRELDEGEGETAAE
eukprot:ANDGO_03652.mRNA.1 hypothetical protein